MLAAALRRNVSHRSLQNLQEGLLHALAGNIASDRGVLVLASDLVDFVDVDHAGLGAADIAVGSLQQLENDVLDILADITSFCQSSCIDDRDCNVEHASESLRQ